MKLYILNPRTDLPEDNDPWYRGICDDYTFVVRAASEKDARALIEGDGEASTIFGKVWLNEEYTSCEELTQEGEEGVIIIKDHSY